jgi:quinoprotein glucose dehydrogenase
MSRLIPWLALALVSNTACTAAAPKASAPDASPATPVPVATVAVLGADHLPTREPQRSIVLGQCQICHSSEYVQQQRLTPAQWRATITKMIGWGAPITVAEGEALAQVLAEAYPPDRPDDVRVAVPTPGAPR